MSELVKDYIEICERGEYPPIAWSLEIAKRLAAMLADDHVMVPRKPLEILDGMDQRHYSRMPTYIKVAISELTAMLAAEQQKEVDNVVAPGPKPLPLGLPKEVG